MPAIMTIDACLRAPFVPYPSLLIQTIPLQGCVQALHTIGVILTAACRHVITAKIWLSLKDHL